MFAFNPADAPSINKWLNLLLLNIKYGGMLFPRAFTHPINVVVEDFGDRVIWLVPGFSLFRISGKIVIKYTTMTTEVKIKREKLICHSFILLLHISENKYGNITLLIDTIRSDFP